MCFNYIFIKSLEPQLYWALSSFGKCLPSRVYGRAHYHCQTSSSNPVFLCPFPCDISYWLGLLIVWWSQGSLVFLHSDFLPRGGKQEVPSQSRVTRKTGMVPLPPNSVKRAVTEPTQIQECGEIDSTSHWGSIKVAFQSTVGMGDTASILGKENQSATVCFWECISSILGNWSNNPGMGSHRHYREVDSIYFPTILTDGSM